MMKTEGCRLDLLIAMSKTRTAKGGLDQVADLPPHCSSPKAACTTNGSSGVIFAIPQALTEKVDPKHPPKSHMFKQKPHSNRAQWEYIPV